MPNENAMKSKKSVAINLNNGEAMPRRKKPQPRRINYIASAQIPCSPNEKARRTPDLLFIIEDQIDTKTTPLPDGWFGAIPTWIFEVRRAVHEGSADLRTAEARAFGEVRRAHGEVVKRNNERKFADLAQHVWLEHTLRDAWHYATDLGADIDDAETAWLLAWRTLVLVDGFLSEDPGTDLDPLVEQAFKAELESAPYSPDIRVLAGFMVKLAISGGVA